uniref:Uncharacterized protein n=1 Tax=viral metagenome TaxID=1070528 RepID=A0A6H1ZL90_9ZZZZ
MSENNAKVSNRQMIELLKNDLGHIQRRVDRIEWWLGGLILAYVAGWIALVTSVVLGG